jgi:transcriptional regulator with XRE-family HTH domain
MEIDQKLTDDTILKLIGERVAGLRLAANLTQQQLAQQAGLGVRTVQRLELGAAATHLSGFLRVCRVLGLLERFELLLPAPPPSPMTQLQLQGRQRRRASGRRKPRATTTRWTWGEPA